MKPGDAKDLLSKELRVDAMLNDICGTADRLAIVLRGGHVVRYHSEPGLRKQTVAEHTWRLCMIMLHLWPETDLRALLTALYHDATEGITGDMPAPTKRQPGIRGPFLVMEADISDFLRLPHEELLMQQEQARLKCADYLELVLTCAEQLPNKNAARICDKGTSYVMEFSKILSEEDQKTIFNFHRDHILPLIHWDI